MANEIGYLKGEICNRDGCDGIINEVDDGSCCSCHINPPCSHCENHSQYCPKCGWDNLEEERIYDKKRMEIYNSEEETIKRNERYENQQRKRKEHENLVNNSYDGKTKVDKIEYYITKAWHRGYAVKGCAPIGTSWEDIKKHFGCNYKESMPKGNYKIETGGFTLSFFTD